VIPAIGGTLSRTMTSAVRAVNGAHRKWGMSGYNVWAGLDLHGSVHQVTERRRQAVGGRSLMGPHSNIVNNPI